jgi:hypothetical protein
LKLTTVDVETRPKLQGGQPEDVSELGSHRDIEDTKVSDGNTLTNKVEININMFGVLMLDGARREVDDIDIAAIHQSGQR